MRYGVALREFVDGSTDDALRALDAFAARSRLPELVPVWCREWQVDGRLFAGIRERGAEPVAYVETSTPTIPVDTLRLFACRIGEGTAARLNQEGDLRWGASWQSWTPAEYVEWWVDSTDVLREEGIRTFWCAGQPAKAQRAGYWPGIEHVDIVGTDAYLWDADDSPEDFAVRLRSARRLAQGKLVWMGETGSKAGLPRRAANLDALGSLDADAMVVMNLIADRPDGGHDDWRFTPSMEKRFAGMVT